jgi:hypothetical protein
VTARLASESGVVDDDHAWQAAGVWDPGGDDPSLLKGVGAMAALGRHCHREEENA